MNIITLPQVDSTSTYLRTHLSEAPHGTIVTTACQMAGRGQRGNSWEAEPGRNLTFSVMLHPRGIEAAGQYGITEAVTTAIIDTLAPLLPDATNLFIKWPNDIYYGDRKLCGILIENTLSGSCILKSIAGIGVNVNQHRFVSDAPNPVSLTQITGKEYDLEALLNEMSTLIIQYAENLTDTGLRRNMATRYRDRLWRRTGIHPYSLPDGTRFMASIESVAPDGMLTLRHDNGITSTHAFKEVSAII